MSSPTMKGEKKLRLEMEIKGAEKFLKNKPTKIFDGDLPAEMGKLLNDRPQMIFEKNCLTDQARVKALFLLLEDKYAIKDGKSAKISDGLENLDRKAPKWVEQVRKASWKKEFLDLLKHRHPEMLASSDEGAIARNRKWGEIVNRIEEEEEN